MHSILLRINNNVKMDIINPRGRVVRRKYRIQNIICEYNIAKKEEDWGGRR